MKTYVTPCKQGGSQFTQDVQSSNYPPPHATDETESQFYWFPLYKWAVCCHLHPTELLLHFPEQAESYSHLCNQFTILQTISKAPAVVSSNQLFPSKFRTNVPHTLHLPCTAHLIVLHAENTIMKFHSKVVPVLSLLRTTA